MNAWFAVTLIGSPELWAGIAAVLIVFYAGYRGRVPRLQQQGLKLFIVVFVLGLALTLGLLQVLKPAFAVPRVCAPCVGDVPVCNPYCPTDPQDYSFPSGHAATVFAVFAAGLFGLRKGDMAKGPRQGSVAAATGLARPRWYPLLVAIPLLVAASRVALGVHTVADVVAGAGLGIVVMFAVAALARRYITA